MVGVSSPEIRNKVIPYILEQVKPRTVFDLGMGSGVYGAFLRHKNKEWYEGLDGQKGYMGAFVKS